MALMDDQAMGIAPAAPQQAPAGYNDPYASAGVNAGLPPNLANYMGRYVNIESGGNPYATTGSYHGLLQQSKDEAAKYGGYGLDSGARMYAGNYNWFKNKFGRDPSPTELYMTAQQGQGGISQHLNNPDQPAWLSMYQTGEGQKKGPGWARQAIWGNVPDTMKSMFPGGANDPNLTSSAFMNLWQNKVEHTPMNSVMASNRPPMQQAMGQNNMSDQSNQYAYAPNYDQNAGLFDRMRQGGPGALFGAPNGTFPGANGRPGYALGNKLQQAAIFGLAINNPGALSALPAIAERNDKKVMQVGTDELGFPIFKGVDNQGNVYPLNNVGGGGAAGTTVGGSGVGTGAGTGNPYSGPTGLVNDIAAAKAAGMDTDTIIKTKVPPSLQPTVRSALEYQSDYNKTLPRNSPLRVTLPLMLHALDDSFDENAMPARIQLKKDLLNPNSKMGGQFTKQGTALGTLADVSDAAVGLGNSNGMGLDALATGYNAVRGQTTDQAAKVKAYEDRVGAYVGEKSQLLYPGTGGSMQERADIRKPFSGYASPQTQADALEAELQVEQRRSDALQQQIDSNHIKGITVVGPAQQAAIDRVKQNIDRLRGNVRGGTAPTVTNIRQIQ